MGLIAVIQEIIGLANHAEIAAETGVFRLPRWYVVLKASFVFGVGLIVIYGALRPSHSARPGPFLLVAVGIVYFAFGVSIARGIRSVTIANEIVTAEFGTGRREEWPLRDLFADEPGGLGSGSVAVRLRDTGRIVFNVPRDLPAWDVLVESIRTARRS